MIAQSLDTIDQQCLSRPAIIVASRSWTYRQLIDGSRSLAARWAHLSGTRVAVAIPDFPSQLVALLALDRLGSMAVLCPLQASSETLQGLLEPLQPIEVLTDLPPIDILSDVQSAPASDYKSPDATDKASSLVMFTSGTSGPPQPARHLWETLASAVHTEEPYLGRRWLLAYQPSTFAGVQVWLQALLSEGTVCLPASNHPDAVATALVDQKIEFASATPTFWRMLLRTVPRQQLAAASLQQITLGGEAVDQEILDALADTFPTARISHIYASTEMGVCFSVHDRRAGFSADLLQEENPSCCLRVSNQGELEIRSRRAMLTEDSQNSSAQSWFATGDLVEIRDDRVYFVGRKSGLINVGGSKVLPEEVEEVIRQVPGVREVRVVGLDSSLVGQLVQAEVQPESESDRDLLRDSILAECQARLAKYKVPATIQFFDHLEHTPSGKLARAVEQTP